MEIQKMQHKEKGNMIFRKHAVNKVFNEGEYTICGLDIIQSNLCFNDFEKVGDEYMGVLEEVNCEECLKVIWFCKNLR